MYAVPLNIRNSNLAEFLVENKHGNYNIQDKARQLMENLGNTLLPGSHTSGKLTVGFYGDLLFWALGENRGVAQPKDKSCSGFGQYFGTPSLKTPVAPTNGMFELMIRSDRTESSILKLYNDEGVLIYTYLGVGAEKGLVGTYVGQWV